jgi:starch phosphorylase
MEGMKMEQRLTRGAGILLPISSLPSPHGIGTFGKAAYQFVDSLKAAGQMYWQVLPIGPTSYGDSPYQSFSAFAGNPYFIDLDMLVEEGLVEKSVLDSIDWGQLEYDIDYSKMYDNRYAILRKAFFKSREREKEEYKEFIADNKEWLDDYSLFMACKDYFEQKEWLKWEEDIKTRKPEALKYYRALLKEKVEFWQYVQYKFFEQWKKLKAYANENGIKIIGDIPIYVALDSSDVWSDPKQYQLDDNLKPIDVAGCPPDAFSDYGQKWGNPIYDWDAMEKDGFSWWMRRMSAASKLYDVIRIDHFIGIAGYYAIPVDGVPVDGRFRNGPGEKLIEAIDKAIGDSKIIAEDLGVAVPEAKRLLIRSGYPGMKVLEFAFDGNRTNEYLPHTYDKNCVVYSGTHDNETLLGYFSSLSEESFQYLMDYTGSNDRSELAQNVITLAYESVADTVIIQMQDILMKNNDARMNLPSTIGKNWRWRLKKGEFNDECIRRLHKLADVYNRINQGGDNN